MKVLIADDEPTSRLILEESLTEWGFETCSASDGDQAWALMQGANPPSLLILDWMMPGMDGTELCRKLRQANRSQYVYIILLTSKSEKRDVLLGMEAGADAFLSKPVDLEDLRTRVVAAQRILGHQVQLTASQPTRIMQYAITPQPSKEQLARAQPYIEGAEDLSFDIMLTRAPRKFFGNRTVPVLGKVLLLNRIGSGGMGAVYRGYNPRLDREMAVKILSPVEVLEQDEAETRFYREARIAALVKSDHLISVKDVDQENGLIFMIMELVHGKTGAECLTDTFKIGAGGMAEDVALDICIAVAQGLAAAHAGGIVHRDVKPDNILVPFKESTAELDYTAAKLADLGIARIERNRSDLTNTSVALGTAGFMAPEQIRGCKHVGKTADVFSLGATLYNLISGFMPFNGESVFEIFTETLNRLQVPIQDRRADVSHATAAVIDICLAKQTCDRYADGATLLEELIYCRNIHANATRTGSLKSSTALSKLALIEDREFLDQFGFPISVQNGEFRNSNDLTVKA